MNGYLVEMEGVVTESLPSTGSSPDIKFGVQLDNGSKVLSGTSRKIRKNYIPISVGDRVKVELATVCSTSGCITYRLPDHKVDA